MHIASTMLRWYPSPAAFLDIMTSAGNARAREEQLLRILGRKNSFNVRKVLWICGELSIPFVREDWGRGYTPTSTPEFLKLNPIGLIPCVVDDGVVLRESNAIVRYLATKYGPD